jgi:plastocyanin
MDDNMNNILGPNSGLVRAVMMALFSTTIVVAMPTNVAAISLLNSEHLVFVTGSPSPDNSTTGEPTGESDIDTSAAVAVISISKGPEGNTVFNPPTTTIQTGGEILILNNDTVAHTIRDGMGPDDPLSGRLFGVGPLEPKGFIEYVATNLQPGTYPFYSTTDPSIKGELVVTN